MDSPLLLSVPKLPSSTTSNKPSRRLHDLLQVMTHDLASSQRRANDAERKSHVLYTQLSTVRSQLEVYKMKLKRAQAEISRAQEEVDRMDKDRFQATLEATKAKEKLRELRTAQKIKAERDKGRTEGYRQGLRAANARRHSEPEDDISSQPSAPSRRSISPRSLLLEDMTPASPAASAPRSILRPPMFSRAASHASTTEAWIPQANADGQITVPPAHDFNELIQVMSPRITPVADTETQTQTEPNSAAASYSDFSILNAQPPTRHAAHAHGRNLQSPLSDIPEAITPQPSLSHDIDDPTSLHDHSDSRRRFFTGTRPRPSLNSILSPPSSNSSNSNSSTSSSDSDSEVSSILTASNGGHRQEISEDIGITIQQPSPQSTRSSGIRIPDDPRTSFVPISSKENPGRMLSPIQTGAGIYTLPHSGSTVIIPGGRPSKKRSRSTTHSASRVYVPAAASSVLLSNITSPDVATPSSLASHWMRSDDEDDEDATLHATSPRIFQLG